MKRALMVFSLFSFASLVAASPFSSSVFVSKPVQQQSTNFTVGSALLTTSPLWKVKPQNLPLYRPGSVQIIEIPTTSPDAKFVPLVFGRHQSTLVSQESGPKMTLQQGATGSQMVLTQKTFK